MYGNYGNPKSDIGRYAEGGVVDSGIEPWRRIPGRDESQMKAEPSLLHKMFTANAGDLGISPMPLGLVMKNPANAVKVANAIRESNPSSAAEYAIAYVKAKYPKLFGLASSIDVSKQAPDSYGSAATWFPSSKKITIDPQVGYSRGVESIGHELTHALQDVRGVVPNEYRGLKASKSLGEPTVSSPSYWEADKAYGYPNNPYEAQANQGGDTAVNTYHEYLRNLFGH